MDDLFTENEVVLEEETNEETVLDTETTEGDILDGETSGEAGEEAVGNGDTLDGEILENGVLEGDSQEGGSAVYNIYSSTVDYDAVYDAVYDASFDAIAAYSQSVTDGQAINNTALSYFQGVLNNRILPTDYVIYVGSPYYYNNSTYYEYCMAYGDLELSGNHFTGTGTIITMRTSGYRSVSYAENQEISLTAPMYYSKSNLGSYSGAVQYDWSGFLTLVALGIGGVTWFMKKLLRVNY